MNGHTSKLFAEFPPTIPPRRGSTTGPLWRRVKNAILGQTYFPPCAIRLYQGLGPADLPRLTEDADLRGQLLLCQSFSKPYAMTGWRAGYLAGPAEVDWGTGPC